MVARIYKPSKTAMQSGKAKTSYWVLEHEASSKKAREPFMGYTSSSDTLSQVRLRFETRDDAVDYAKRNGIAYRVSEPKEFTRVKTSYSENFRYDRKVPWTH
ncbi:MAG: ETC complex I subunit [Pseudomonadota bacterium]